MKIGMSSDLYVLGTYLVGISVGYCSGSIMGGLGLTLKIEKWVLIISFFMGIAGIVPMILEYYDESDERVRGIQAIVLVTLTGFLFSIQIGILETVLLKIIAVNTKDPELQLVWYKVLISACAAAFFFTGL